MKQRIYSGILWSTVLLLSVQAAAAAGSEPVAVSPGKASELASIGGTCPTFSWGEVEGATSYELVVYRLGGEAEEARPVLGERIPGSALGWTPSLDLCLERGGQYAWSVRAVVDGEASDWSRPNLFQVASAPSPAELEEALAIVRLYLASQQPAAARRASDPASRPAPGRVAARPLRDTGPQPRVAAAISTALDVDDNVRITRGDTPRLRLEQDASANFDVFFWDIAGNHQSFTIEDATNETIPFVIASSAPSDSLVVESSGNVKTVSISGDGSRLTLLDPTSLSAGTAAIDISGNAATASDVACTDCVSVPELAFDPATQGELDGHAVGNPTAHHAPPASLPPSGPAGGDLTGGYPNPEVLDDSHSHSLATIGAEMTRMEQTIRIARCLAGSGQPPYLDLGDGTILDCATGGLAGRAEANSPGAAPGPDAAGPN